MPYEISLSATPKKNPYPGLFLALEGIDGSGKTSQIQPLKAYFEGLGRNVTVAKTPRRTDGILAAINNDLMLGTGKIPKPAYQYLFTADYIIQTEQIIIPALQKGDVVIIDRYHCWSSVAYGLWEVDENYDVSQGMSMLLAQGFFTPGYKLIVPDRTFLLDVTIQTALDRMSGKKEDQEFYEEKDVLEKVQKGYNWLLKEFPDLITKISAQKSIRAVTQAIVQNLPLKGEYAR